MMYAILFDPKVEKVITKWKDIMEINSQPRT